MLWTAVLRWAAQLISWAATLYAARILAPTDFGLVSMAGIAIGLVRLAENFGLDAVLVQDRSIQPEEQARLAGVVLLVGGILTALLALVSPLVAAFFQQNDVTPIVRGLSFLLLLDAIQVVPRAHLQRTLQFRRLALVSFVNVLATSTILTVAATAGLREWSLVLRMLGGATVAAILLTMWAPYAVSWPRRIATIMRPILQGWRVLASRVAWYGTSTADQAIIGRILGSSALGTYSFALQFSSIAQEEIGSIVSQVVPGVFSAIQDRIAELRRYYLLLTEFLTVLSFPVTLGLASVADVLIPLAVGDKWQAAITPLRLLCLYSAFVATQTLNAHVLLWTGQFRTQMWLSVLSFVALPLGLMVGVNFGLNGVAMTWAILGPILGSVAFIYVFRTTHIGIRDWLVALKPATTGCVVMILAVVTVRSVIPTNSLWIRTWVAVLTGMIVYPTVLWLFFRKRIRTLAALALSLRAQTAQDGSDSAAAPGVVDTGV
jgi:teichuronic acid exporter